MKNYFKFIVAVVAITFATFGSISSASAKVATESAGHCSGGDCCGTSNLGNPIDGNYFKDGSTNG